MGAAPIGRSHGRRTIEKRLSASFVGRPLFEVAETEAAKLPRGMSALRAYVTPLITPAGAKLTGAYA